MLSDARKPPLKVSSQSQQYNLSSNQNQGQNGPNFKTSEATSALWRSPAKILQEEKLQIIKLGFQLQAEERISLKKYYESTQQYSLFQIKGYSIKYETIRRTKLYQQLKYLNEK
jgi:hypothetical protein